jgi:hypothetical protein
MASGVDGFIDVGAWCDVPAASDSFASPTSFTARAALQGAT